MPRNGSGTASVVNTFTAGTTITSSDFNENCSDFADELTNSLALDGQSTMTGQFKAANGTAAAPSMTFGSDTDSGFYRSSANEMGLALAGAAEFLFTGSAFSPATSDGNALGTSSLMWADLFLATGAVINFNAGDVTVTHSANTLAFAGATSGYHFDALVRPTSNDGAPLGDGNAAWSDLFLASGGVVNFNNGDVVLTHSANTLTFTGGVLAGVANDATILRLNRTAGENVDGVTGVAEIMHNPAATVGIAIGSTAGNDTGTAIEFRNAAGAQQGSISVNGSATAYNTSSDARLKEDHQPVVGALDIIDRLSVSDFAWKATGERMVGLIAQEAIAVAPQMVTRNATADTWGIDYSKAVPFLIAAVQELRRKVQALGA